MTIDEVQDRLTRIGVLADRRERESAHEEEDNLYKDVLTVIAEGKADNPTELAAAALQAGDIGFPRWYA